MSVVRSALIQTFGSMSMEENVERQSALVEQAAAQGAQITCLQELSTGPYFSRTRSFTISPKRCRTARRRGACKRWRRSTKWC